MSRNLTGLWIGEYRYPSEARDPLTHTAFPPVSFTARISDQGGAFLGEITEDGAPPSTIRGTREGSSVTFSKRYASTGGGRFLDRIIYEGGLNEDATRIDGTWMITRVPDHPGEFFMMRETPKPKEREIQREAEIV